jgi:hypothetical protein
MNSVDFSKSPQLINLQEQNKIRDPYCLKLWFEFAICLYIPVILDYWKWTSTNPTNPTNFPISSECPIATVKCQPPGLSIFLIDSLHTSYRQKTYAVYIEDCFTDFSDL